MDSSSILSFTSASKGSGRGSNDSKNKLRENILEHLLTDSVTPFLSDPVHGAAWVTLQAQWRSILEEIATRAGISGYTAISVHHAGGRGKNYDFDVEYVGVQSVHVEFKFNAMPQFVSLGANKVFHSIDYAAFFYDNYLPRIVTLYDIPLSELPSRETYIKHVCSADYKKMTVVQKMYTMEAADRLAHKGSKGFKPRQKALVEESISAYLTFVKDSTDLAAISAEYARTQEGKYYVIYKNGNFTIMTFKPEELVATSVVRVSKNTLITASGVIGVYHHMLLRWKNHLGLLYPAWQISLKHRA